MNAGHVFHRFTSARPPIATRGEGIYLFDSEGRRFVDACGGAAVSCLGHGHAEIAAAVAEQAGDECRQQPVAEAMSPTTRSDDG